MMGGRPRLLTLLRARHARTGADAHHRDARADHDSAAGAQHDDRHDDRAAASAADDGDADLDHADHDDELHPAAVRPRTDPDPGAQGPGPAGGIATAGQSVLPGAAVPVWAISTAVSPAVPILTRASRSWRGAEIRLPLIPHQEQSCCMNVTRIRLVGLIGAAAMVTLGAVGVATTGVTTGGAVAGSDHAPTNTTFNQPQVPEFNSGSTMTLSPAETTASSMSAAPVVKAG